MKQTIKNGLDPVEVQTVDSIIKEMDLKRDKNL